MNTLLLDRTTWDLVIDTLGNIAMATNPYSQAQDAGSACRTFFGEVYFDTSIGIPFLTVDLGYAPPLALVRAQFQEAAAAVPEVQATACFFSSWTERHLQGQVQITDSVTGLTAGMPI